jgi:glycosyltransferase involved in cell wall biosynthesis
MSVTVVIPTRDRWPLLRQTLASVIAQRDVELEIVVVDDASTTPVAELVDSLGDSRLRVLRHDRAHGVAAARNTGLATVRTRWVAFTDDDDLWAPAKLREQLDALATDPAARWSCVGVVDVDGDLRPIGWAQPPRSGDVSAAMLTTNIVPGGGSGVLADIDTVRSVGGFDEALRNLADYELWLRLAIAAPLAAVDRPLLAYRIHRGGLSRQLDDVGDEYRYVLAKHAGELRARAIEPVANVHFWAADRLERSGRRGLAARAYVRSARTVALAPALRRLLMLAAPGAVDARDRWRARLRPIEWVGTDLDWLTALAAAAAP